MVRPLCRKAEPVGDPEGAAMFRELNKPAIEGQAQDVVCKIQLCGGAEP